MHALLQPVVTKMKRLAPATALLPIALLLAACSTVSLDTPGARPGSVAPLSLIHI